LPYISILAHPTFGGVAASFAALGDVLIAEPGAQIGFAGPRVIESTIGERIPEDSHSAERLFASGLVDLLVDRSKLRETVAYLVGHLSPGARDRLPSTPKRSARRAKQERIEPPDAHPWQEVQLARHPQRPTSMDYIERLFGRFVELHGDRESRDDPAIVAGLGELGQQTVVVVGHEKGRTVEERALRNKGMPYPEGFRKAIRLMRLAAKFELPLITLVDTPGAYPGYEAEQRGIWQAIARALQTMSVLPTPIVSVVVGEGGSGGALALGVGDKVLMLEHAIYSVISPEGAAAILYRDASKAEAVAGALKITAEDLLRLGIIDAVVREPKGGAHTNPDEAADVLRRHLLLTLRELGKRPVRKLLRARHRKYRHIGRVGIYWREVVRGEMQDLLDALETRLRRGQGGSTPSPSEGR
jgi:acetyl-CoA carboxylase carboxyl transferase alpha subunit